MSDAFPCPHCEMIIEGADDLGSSLTSCPHCHGPLSTSIAPAPEIRPTSSAQPPNSPTRFTFTCQRCASILEATSVHSNHVGRCPTCGATFIVPIIDPRTAVPLNRATVADDGQLPTPMHAYAAAGGRAPKIERAPDGSQSIVCPRCAGRSPVEANLCSNCGTPFTMEGASEIAQAASGVPRLASASLVIALLACLPLGPLAIILGILALQNEPPPGSPRSGHAVAWSGIVIGALASVGWVIAIFS